MFGRERKNEMIRVLRAQCRSSLGNQNFNKKRYLKYKPFSFIKAYEFIRNIKFVLILLLVKCNIVIVAQGSI